MKFVNASSVRTRRENVNREDLNVFINLFNLAVKNGIDGESVMLNDGLDGIPNLNDAEFARAVILAKEQGWKLTRFEDNYQTTTYKMEKYL